MITNLIFHLLINSLYQEQVPYKPSEEFELKIDYIFKERPSADHPLLFHHPTEFGA